MPNQILRLILLSCAWLAIATSANAGIYVDKAEHPKKVVVFKIQGKISHTDVSAFQNALNEIKNDGYKIKLNSVVLDSNGGSGKAAVAIGKIIRNEKHNFKSSPSIPINEITRFTDENLKSYIEERSQWLRGDDEWDSYEIAQLISLMPCKCDADFSKVTAETRLHQICLKCGSEKLEFLSVGVSD